MRLSKIASGRDDQLDDVSLTRNESTNKLFKHSSKLTEYDSTILRTNDRIHRFEVACPINHLHYSYICCIVFYRKEAKVKALKKINKSKATLKQVDTIFLRLKQLGNEYWCHFGGL